MIILNKLIKYWQSLRFYLIADPADNSITLSRALFNHMRNNALGGDTARVFVFRIAGSDCYGFMVNPDISQPSQFCDIQYNDKYKCIGFESLCPSVGKILYDYNLNAHKSVKLSVSVMKTQGKTFYKIDKPNAKHIDKLSKG